MTDKFSRSSHTYKADSGPQARVRRFAFVLLTVLVLSSILFSAASAAPEQQTVASDVVISELRTRGPAGTSDEFIELFNPTNGPIVISDWTIKISGSCDPGSTDLLAIPNPTILLPGQHYLIANASVGSMTPTPDITYPDIATNRLSDTGGVALFDNATTPVMKDAIGLCADTLYFEGFPIEPSISSGSAPSSYERLPGGAYGSCYDANDNIADFRVINPSDPENMTNIDAPCIVSLLFTPTPTDTLSPTDTLVPVTNTPTVTSTSTITITVTHTRTSTSTLSPSPTLPFRRIIINEVAWAGTNANASDKWIELYNPGPGPVNLNGWVLNFINPNVTIPLDNRTIPANGYYLLERDQNTTNITADQIDNRIGLLENSGSFILLDDQLGRRSDTANFNQGAWPAGTISPSRCSMERASATADDSDRSWFTNNGIRQIGLDEDRKAICGTPKMRNWAYSVTITPSPTPSKTRTPSKTPTRTKTKTPTTAPLAVSSVVINEFLVKPRADYNQDGVVNASDAFIEIKNLSTISVSIGGYYLDDQAGDSSPFFIPSTSLAPGARQVFFASETHIILSEAVDSVRLFKSSSFISDAYTYTGGVKIPNQSWCRYPDGKPSWTFGCEPTPGEENKLAQIVIIDDDTDESELTLCLSKTVPELVREAECLAPGLAVWSPIYWLAQLQREYPLYLPRNEQYDILE